VAPAFTRQKLMSGTELTSLAVRQTLARIGPQCEKLVLPSLVPIYIRPDQNDAKVRQIGTGFLLLHNRRPVLMTAKHVLYGKKFNERPFEKYAVFNGLLRPLLELKSTDMVKATAHDLCCIYADEFGTQRCLPETVLAPSHTPSTLISIYGLLGRDFFGEASETDL
jgi:hypothetical protein